MGNPGSATINEAYWLVNCTGLTTQVNVLHPSGVLKLVTSQLVSAVGLGIWSKAIVGPDKAGLSQHCIRTVHGEWTIHFLNQDKFQLFLSLHLIHFVQVDILYCTLCLF